MRHASGRTSLLCAAWTLLAGLFGGVAFADGWIHVHRPPDLGSDSTWRWGGLVVTKHHVDVSIEGDLATVEVREVFRNPHRRDLEGTYYFPLPADAGIDDFRLQMNGQELAGEILLRDDARRIYEDLVRRVRDPALLEYYERGLVKARVFPIPALGDVAVTLRYRQTLRASGCLTTFRYPMDTGRFSAGPYQDVRILVDLAADAPLKSVSSPSHDVAIERRSPRHVQVRYESASDSATQDFVIEYLSSAEPLAGGVKVYAEPGDDGYFVLRLAPGVEPPTDPPPARLVFLVDTSGSMAGSKIEQARETLRGALHRLRQKDEFQLLAFSTRVQRFEAQPVLASPENIARAQAFVSSLVARGGTDIDSALQEAVRSAHLQGSSTLLLISDGAPTVGVTDANEIVRRARECAGRDARVHVFGLGQDVNTVLLDDLARNLGGSRSYVAEAHRLESAVSSTLDRILYPSLTGLRVEAVGADIHTLAPREPSDLFFGEDLILAGRYRGEGVGRLVVIGQLDGVEQRLVVQTDFQRRGGRDSVAYQWAQLRILDLLDEYRSSPRDAQGSVKSEIARLGLRYGIVTPFTSFLIREAEGYAANVVRDQIDRSSRAQELMKSAEQGFGAPAGRDSFDYAQAQASRKRRLAEGKLDFSPESDGGFSEVAIVRKGGRAFVRADGVWVDGSLSTAEAPKPDLILTFASDEYFEYLRTHPRASSLFAARDSMIVAFEGSTIQVVPARATDHPIQDRKVESF